jgi:superfamily I DNA/RNA helicase
MTQTATAALALISKLICTPSPMQAKVIHFVVDGQGSAIVDAVAGAGKTKTLEMILLALPEGVEVVLVAFNTAIAAELNARIDNLRRLTGRAFANVQAATFHSIGNGILRRGLRKYNGRANKYKIRDLIDRTFTPAARESALSPMTRRTRGSIS